MKISSLADLGPEWRQHREARRLAQQAIDRWAQAQADLQTARLAKHAHQHAHLHAHAHANQYAGPPAAPHGLFARSVGPVLPLRDPGWADVYLPRPPPHPRQRELDEQAALAESLSDEVNLESLLLTDDGLSFRRPGIGPDVVAKLRRGFWAQQGQIDLHGCNRDQARDVLAGYIRDSHRSGKRCLRVVHGKGHGSPGRQPVLKSRVQRWLAQRAEVIAFAQASGPQGGAGALMVLLAGLGR